MALHSYEQARPLGGAPVKLHRVASLGGRGQRFPNSSTGNFKKARSAEVIDGIKALGHIKVENYCQFIE